MLQINLHKLSGENESLNDVKRAIQDESMSLLYLINCRVHKNQSCFAAQIKNSNHAPMFMFLAPPLTCGNRSYKVNVNDFT